MEVIIDTFRCLITHILGCAELVKTMTSTIQRSKQAIPVILTLPLVGCLFVQIKVAQSWCLVHRTAATHGLSQEYVYSILLKEPSFCIAPHGI